MRRIQIYQKSSFLMNVFVRFKQVCWLKIELNSKSQSARLFSMASIIWLMRLETYSKWKKMVGRQNSFAWMKKDNEECKFTIMNVICEFDSGFFVFHYGSSIGTHQIEISNKEKEKKLFPVVVIWKRSKRERFGWPRMVFFLKKLVIWRFHSAT